MEDKVEIRSAAVQRRTRETDIEAGLKLDGSGKVTVETGVGFFDHMLSSAMTHGFFDLELTAKGDTHVDDHHTVEDVGIVLGQAFSRALGDYKGITRFGHAVVPMDEALASATIDFSKRPFLYYDDHVIPGKVGRFDTELMEEFWRAFAMNAGINLHLECIRGKNAHHIFEAMFKAAGRALDQATRLDPRISDVISTKGVL